MWTEHKNKFLNTYKMKDSKPKAMADFHYITQNAHETVNRYNIRFNTFVAEAQVVNPDADGNLMQQYFCSIDHFISKTLLPHMPAGATQTQQDPDAMDIDAIAVSRNQVQCYNCNKFRHMTRECQEE
ncbi:uncharacterized protein PHACADRAFT_98936 [Phanerochaete carnosa HHB-10118-sp]|uniref:CCHC-type domain-containing protein n=1 Tax=Phanerochaete carnosa (strain HHB-10118-sp) TaxID=650164 RepID=K5VNW8_PHACS|nr:uncharacterized protein PHACADRAFT_98936 [Phanerochaete carnosa HHB-10118-sp]EKM53168.1 hypothetical protein PHACADRAFT_98936 [Phanerochaete carnosa HHB-10118-sp]